MEFQPEETPFGVGRWEARGGSPVGAAVFGLLAIGAFYFFAQIVFMVGGLALSVMNVEKLLHLRESIESGADDALIINPIRWAVVLSQYLALLIPTALFIRTWHTRSIARYVRFRPAPVFQVLLAVVGTALIIPIGALISSLLRNGAPEQSDVEKLTEKIFTAHSPMEFWFLVAVVAVTPAICEEFFFRGYVQRTFERTMGARSVPLVGVIFGLFHMQPQGLVTLAFIGMWLGFVYHRSRSMLPNMAAHFTNNFIAIWLVYAAPVVFGIDLKNDESLPILWALAAVPLFAAVVWGYLRMTEDNHRAEITSLP